MEKYETLQMMHCCKLPPETVRNPIDLLDEVNMCTTIEAWEHQI